MITCATTRVHQPRVDSFLPILFRFRKLAILTVITTVVVYLIYKEDSLLCFILLCDTRVLSANVHFPRGIIMGITTSSFGLDNGSVRTVHLHFLQPG